MAVVLPFRAVRPHKEYAAKVASYPYDVISSDEAGKIAKDNPLTFLRVTKAEIDLPGTNPYSDKVYARARRNFDDLLRRGVLFQDKKPAFYVYRQKNGRHEQCGIGACVHVREFAEGRVKKHEMTLPEKEFDRTRHIDTVNAQTGPIFLTYRSRAEINQLVKKIRESRPEYDFMSEDGVSHALWVVSGGEAVRKIEKAFRDVQVMYIADGHHRAAAGVAVASMRDTNGDGGPCLPFKLILAVLFPHDDLRIRDYNRVVKDISGMDEAEFTGRLEKKFFIESGYGEKTPKGPREFGMYLKGKWYRLRAKDGSYPADDIVGSLDVAILQENVLGPILGIRDPRGDARIRFIGAAGGVGELESMVDSGQYEVAFALYPPTVEQMMKVADAGKVMPPKSTWFEPKLRDGIMVHLLDEEA